MRLCHAFLWAWSHLILTTEAQGTIIILILEMQLGIFPKTLQLVRGKAGIWTKSISQEPVDLNHFPLDLTLCTGGRCKANSVPRVQSTFFKPGSFCMMPTAFWKSVSLRWAAVLPTDHLLSGESLSLVKGGSLWLNYSKSCLVKQGTFLSPPVINWFFQSKSQSPRSLQSHSPQW